MKRKYMTRQVLLACLSTSRAVQKDIYTQLEETIAERRRLLQEWEKLFATEPDNCFDIQDKQAA